jgi:hypothetical protein
MSADTYIGNAPNFMVKSICEERGIKIPSFFDYMLRSGGILLPLFALLTISSTDHSSYFFRRVRNSSTLPMEPESEPSCSSRMTRPSSARLS